MNQQAHPEESQRAQPAIRDDKLTSHTTDVLYTCKCTGEKLISRTSAKTDTEAVPNEIPNDCNMASEAVPNEVPNDCDMATKLVPYGIEYDHRTY